MDPVTLISSDEDLDSLFIIDEGTQPNPRKASRSRQTKRNKVKHDTTLSHENNPLPEDLELAEVTRSDSITRSKLALIHQELKYIDKEIDRLFTLKEQKQIEKEQLEKILDGHRDLGAEPGAPSYKSFDISRRGFEGAEDFPWSKAIREKLKSVWNIDEFRFNQLQVINATLSKRDVMVLMPTGGGKSLCYQLPAIIDRYDNGGKPCTKAITIVITPLISLIRDQLFDLKKVGVPAAALFGATTKEHRQAISLILKSADNGFETWRKLGLQGPPRLLYVTPEQIAKSKRFLSCLEKAYRDDRLARFVIDECHCCSQSSHDFRPDYKKLGVLRTLFPKVPILALTATCSPSVMDSVLSILGLKRTSLGGCLVLKSSLLRPNLSYSVVPKPAQASEVIDKMVDFITMRHLNETGIIYCLSRKDTEVVTAAINNLAGGTIPTRAYHADMDEDEKHAIHTAWRSGEIKVVVATVAFGLGINHPDVRFVIHHTMSKSLDGYYQESGRAGRDGLPSECVLFFRGADVARVTSMAVTEPEGLDHAYAMVRYAMGRNVCRTASILKYFSVGRIALPLDDSGPIERQCKSCDLCRQRSPKPVQDFTQVALTILHVLQALSPTTAKASAQRVTCNQLVTYLKATTSVPPPLLALRDSGAVTLPVSRSVTKELCETIILRLLLCNYIKEDFHFTAYASISYLVLAPLGKRALSCNGSFKVLLESP